MIYPYSDKSVLICGGNYIYEINSISGKYVSKRKVGHGICGIASLSKEKNLLCLQTNDDKTIIYNTTTEKVVSILKEKTHSNEYFSTRNKYIAAIIEETSFPYSSLALYSVKSGKQIWKTSHVNNNSAYLYGRYSKISFNHNETLVACISQDYNIYVFNVENGKLVSKLEGHTGEVENIEFNPISNVLLSASKDGNVMCWDAVSGIRLQTFNIIPNADVHYTDVNAYFDGEEKINVEYSSAPDYIRYEKELNFMSLQSLINIMTKRFENKRKQFSIEERRKYYLE